MIRHIDMKKIKNLVFDFDGTLVDTAPLIVATMQAAIGELGLEPRTDSECQSTIGLRLEEIPSVLWPENSEAKEKYAATYRRIFEILKRPLSVECFPGVIDTLRKLHAEGFRMAIASSRSHRSLQEYTDMFYLTGCFSMLVGGDDVVHGKPSPDPVIKILDTCGWNADETITVGDAPVDIMMGRAAETLTCAVTYGNGKEDELKAAHPTFMIGSFAELQAIVKE